MLLYDGADAPRGRAGAAGSAWALYGLDWSVVVSRAGTRADAGHASVKSLASGGLPGGRGGCRRRRRLGAGAGAQSAGGLAVDASSARCGCASHEIVDLRV